MTAYEVENPRDVPDGWLRFSLTATASQGATNIGRYEVEFQGKTFNLLGNQHWKTSSDGFRRLIAGKPNTRARRIHFDTYGISRIFPLVPMTNNWSDLRWGFDAGEKRYVVETNPGIIERCLLMTTDPGDLVLDPTCGSGTTAYVAERRGRRWIVIDTSRVALALAKHRLLTAKFDYYQLRHLNADDEARNRDGTWIAELDDAGKPTGKRLTLDCATSPHITLRSIARKHVSRPDLRAPRANPPRLARGTEPGRRCRGIRIETGAR